MVKDDILKLIPQLSEGYQDIELKGELLAKGKRECQERWDLIKDHIKPHDTVLDLGSATGYFSKKIAQTYPDSLVISFESDPIMCQIQSLMYEAEGIYNVVVCNYRLGKEDILRWLKHTEVFDVLLALSVLHHYQERDAGLVWEGLQSMFPMIIGEFPSSNETPACGGIVKEKLQDIFKFTTVTIIGTVPSHLGEYQRKLWIKDTPDKRLGLDAFFGVSHPDRHRFEIKDGKINGKHIIKGINVWNLLHFNIVWPKPMWWKVNARAAYESLEFKSDVKPWNLLVNSTGIKAIDFTTKFKENDKASYHPKDLEKMDKIFTEMKPDENII